MTDRRHFLKTLSSLTAALMVAPSVNSAPKRDRLGEWMPARKLGKTGEEVTSIGIGGYHFGHVSEKEAQALLETALENGLRFIDCAVQYQNGGSEKRMGKLISPKYRDVVFLMTKTKAYTADEARNQLDDSLRRLNTDYLDLWQVHSVDTVEDVDRRIDNGILEVVQKAKEDGKVRYIGFTGHRTYKAHLRMLEKTQDKDILETCQMPINAVDPHYNSFIRNVLPKLVDRNLGVIAMKTLGFGDFLDKKVDGKTVVPDTISMRDAIHFVLSLPISVLVTGAESAAQIKEKIDLAKSFEKLDSQAREAIVDKVAAFKQQVEYYKA
ncbi:aldo/keto reductase [bacterium]|nr:aldo/keto reductase [bacterium]